MQYANGISRSEGLGGSNIDKKGRFPFIVGRTDEGEIVWVDGIVWDGMVNRHTCPSSDWTSDLPRTVECIR